MTSVVPPANPLALLRAIRDAAAHVEHRLSRALEPHGLTTAQFTALQLLADAERGMMGCTEIRERLTGVAPDVTRLLDRLESAGMVSRSRDTTDRRVVHATLTAQARALLDVACDDARDAEEGVLSDLSPAERHELSRLLANVQRKCPGRNG